MTPTEQAAAILAACGSRPGHPLRLAFSGIIAVAIRAAVDLVLPEPPARSAFLPSEYELAAREDWHLEARAQFLAIADAMEAPTDA